MPSLQARVAANFSFDLASDLRPIRITGGSQVNVEKTGGTLSDMADLAIHLDSDVTPLEVKKLAVRFLRGEAALGEIRAHGPVDMAKTEGRLNVEILSIDRQVLNLAGAASGVDFGSTLINSTNQIDLANGGQVISVVGTFNAASLSLSQKGQTTPALDLRFNYDVTVSRAAEIGAPPGH